MTTLPDEQLADLRAQITPGPWSSCKGGECTCGQVWSIPHDHPVASATKTPWGDERWVAAPTDDDRSAVKREMIEYGSFPQSQFHANARLIAAAPDLLDEVVRLREAFSNCRKWPFHVIPMPFTADGKGPATIGVDAAHIAYEVWDTDYMCHASFDNLPDAINEAMRLTVATLTTEKNDG